MWFMRETVLEIAPAAQQSWQLLPHGVRRHIAAFVGEPDASRLSIAFPRLTRRVTVVFVNESITVRLRCEGVHEGMWGDIIPPTRRRIAFAEQHEIVAVDGCVVSDRIALDLEAILMQLCGDGRIDPDETARLGTARREWPDCET